MGRWKERQGRWRSSMLPLLLLLATVCVATGKLAALSSINTDKDHLLARVEALAAAGNREGVVAALGADGGWAERGLLSANQSERLGRALLSVDRPFEALDLLRNPGWRDMEVEVEGWAAAALLQADVCVEVGEWDEAARLYEEVRARAERGSAAAREASARLGVVHFAQGVNLTAAWEAWRAAGVEEGVGGDEGGLLWLCRRELGFLHNLFPHRPPPPPSSCGPAGCCARGSRMLDVFYSHLLTMTFLDELGALDASLRHLHLAATLCPSPELELRAALATPIVYDSTEAMREGRRALLLHGGVLDEAVARARALLLAAHSRPSPPERAPHLQFSVTPAHMFIGYQGLEDQQAQLRVAEAHLQVYPYLHHAPHLRLRNTTTNTADGRVRVGFASSFLWSHSVGRLLHQVIARLDRRRFYVHILHVGEAPPPEDPVASALSRAGDDDVVLSLPTHDLEAAAAVVTRQQLDVLVFPELGMDTHTYLLAFRRMARVQVVFWGHPVSQGLPSVDYFLTSDLFEPNHAGAGRYHEQRLLMDTIGTFFLRPPAPTAMAGAAGRVGEEEGRASFGLSDDSHVYLLCQTLMKFHTDMDRRLLAPLLERDLAAVLVITYNRAQRMWRHRLEERFRRTIGPLGCRRIFFLPSLEKRAFYSLLRTADVVVDTFPFGGGVTALEALAAGTVVVTVPSVQTVPQLAAGMYRRMGLPDMVSDTVEECVERAVNLASNHSFREQELHRLEARLPLLYEDSRVVTEWEDVLHRLSVQ